MTRQQERDEFTDIMVDEFPDHNRAEVRDMARRFMRYAGTASRFAEMACNVNMTPAETRRDEQNDARIHKLAAEWGLVAVLQGDPRGCIVKLQVPSGRTNDWGKVGICVPEGN